MGLLRELVRRCRFAWHRPRHWRFRPGTLDRRIFQHVVLDNEYRLPERFAPDDVVLDVGGHIGSFAMAALRRGVRRVVVCEPAAANFDLLAANLAPYGARAVVRRVAVWGDDTPADGLRLGNPLDPRNTGAWRVGSADGANVPAVAFDDLVESVGERVRLVKLDCEGAEWPILTTARRLDRVEALCGEYHLGDFAPPGASVDLLVATLERAGFRVEVVPDRRSPYPVGLFFADRGEPCQ